MAGIELDFPEVPHILTIKLLVSSEFEDFERIEVASVSQQFKVKVATSG
jgi:hypothetical protein